MKEVEKMGMTTVKNAFIWRVLKYLIFLIFENLRYTEILKPYTFQNIRILTFYRGACIEQRLRL